VTLGLGAVIAVVSVDTSRAVFVRMCAWIYQCSAITLIRWRLDLLSVQTPRAACVACIVASATAARSMATSQTRCAEFLPSLDKHGGPTAYLFRCLHCGTHLAYWDIG
jgi:uncharacterized protein CbrC (UPF0167 family)